MSLNGIIVYKVISFGDLVTPFFYWRPLIGHKIYYESVKYNFITLGGGEVSEISDPITMGGGRFLERVNFV